MLPVAIQAENVYSLHYASFFRLGDVRPNCRSRLAYSKGANRIEIIARNTACTFAHCYRDTAHYARSPGTF